MLWEDITQTASWIGTEPGNIFQEELQKAVLTSLSQSGCFEHIVFQGGTALRLFYANPRFSEDIDLVHRVDEKRFDLLKPLSAAKRLVQFTFPFIDSVEVRHQTDEQELQRSILRTLSDMPDQKTRLHIELATIPSYLNEPRVLDHPPVHPAVRVEKESEILADKVCALALRPYLKGRDLWDIFFLAELKRIPFDWGLVEKKIVDYGGAKKDLVPRLKEVEDIIEHKGEKVLVHELKRFLPLNVMANYRNDMELILRPVVELIGRAEKISGR